MTTPRALRAYLNAHGIDGAPTKPGCFAVLWRIPFGVQHVSLVEAAEHCGHLCMWVGGRSEETMKYADCIIRHAPLNLAPPVDRNLDAEVVAGVQAGRDDMRAIIESGKAAP